MGKCDPAAALSDGTPNYLGAAALRLAYQQWDARGGMQAVERHTQALAAWLRGELLALRHSNGAPLIQLYGRHAAAAVGASAADAAGFGQGAVFNFQVLQPDGQPLSYSRVDREAAAAGIYMRSGCVCNPGVSLCVCVVWGGGGWLSIVAYACAVPVATNSVGFGCVCVRAAGVLRCRGSGGIGGAGPRRAKGGLWRRGGLHQRAEAAATGSSSSRQRQLVAAARSCQWCCQRRWRRPGANAGATRQRARVAGLGVDL